MEVLSALMESTLSSKTNVSKSSTDKGKSPLVDADLGDRPNVEYFASPVRNIVDPSFKKSSSPSGI